MVSRIDGRVGKRGRSLRLGEQQGLQHKCEMTLCLHVNVQGKHEPEYGGR